MRSTSSARRPARSAARATRSRTRSRLARMSSMAAPRFYITGSPRTAGARLQTRLAARSPTLRGRRSARTTTVHRLASRRARRPSAAAARLALLRQRGERRQPAAIAAAVRVKELRVTGGAQARVLDARRLDARPPEQRLVGGPEVQHDPAGPPGSGPRLPVVRVSRGELPRHRLVDLVAARADRGRDGRAESLGAGAERPERSDDGLGGAAHRTPPADVRRAERVRLGIVEDDREAVGCEDRERRARRSEERRVGKECRSRWSPNNQKRNRVTIAASARVPGARQAADEATA